MKTLSANVNDNIPNVAFNDIYLNAQGNISISLDQEAVLEGCSQAAQTLLGELIYFVNQGIPYFETIWIGIPNVQQYTAALRAAFLNVPNVIEVLSLSITQIDDIFNYTATIRTNFGTGVISG